MPTIKDIYYHSYEGSKDSQRPVIVLIHGAGGTHLYWPPEMRRLPGCKVYALDLPGHGKSGGRGLQSISAYAQVVLEWLMALGVYSVTLVGHSMGSAIALNLALDHAEHVVSLALIGAGARLKVSAELLENSASPTTYQNAVNTVINWGFGSGASPRLKELASRRMLEIRPSVLYGDFIACNTFDVTDKVGQIRQPTLIMCGLDDRMTPLRYAQYLVEQIPNATLKTFPQAGHMLMLEKPQIVADALLGFVTGVRFL